MGEFAFHPVLWWIAVPLAMFFVGRQGGFALYLPVAVGLSIVMAALWYMAMYTNKRFDMGFGLFVVFSAAPAYVIGMLAGFKTAMRHRRKAHDTH